MPNLWVTPDELEGEASSPFAYEAAKTASFILWAFSGRKYTGVRTVSERYECPCTSLRFRVSARFMDQPGLFAIEPYLIDGALSNAIIGGCGCEGGTHSRLRLRRRPVRSIQKVVASGSVVSPDSYQVINSSFLQATPGHSLDICGLDVTYTYGVEPPTAGKRAARHLAQELAKGWGGGECELPERVTSVSRQGVSYTILDNQDFLDEMRTGIYTVDLFLRAVNPDKARKPARVFSPDLPRVSRVTSNPVAPITPFDMPITPHEPYAWSVALEAINADILLDANWGPQGQITAWNGATLLEFNEPRFVIADGTLTVNLTGAETGAITGDGSFDLYAVHQVDLSTVVHLLTSSVRLMGN